MASAPPPKDPAHWLYRLTSDEWLSAAETELGHCESALLRRAFRPGVTHARRAAGMAWNAVLVAAGPDASGSNDRYGRSYMEHLVALADDDGAPTEARQAAAALRDTPPAPPELVTIGKPDLGPLRAAQALVAYARARAGNAQESTTTG